MKKLLFFVVLIVTVLDATAQKVIVSARASKVSNENADGYSSDLDASAEDVKIAMSKFMKEAGKTKSNGEMITVAGPVINGTPYASGTLYATVSGSEVKTRVWIGIVKGQFTDA